MATLDIEVPQKSQNIYGTIIMKAPLAKVFDAHTKWWGRGSNPDMRVNEAVTGGHWHMAEKAEDGNTYEFMGSYHEIAKNERIIWTFEFLGLPERGHVAMEKMEFKALDDNTTEIKTTSTYMSVEDRDAMVATGMEDGWRMSNDQMEKMAQQ